MITDTTDHNQITTHNSSLDHSSDKLTSTSITMDATHIIIVEITVVRFVVRITGSDALPTIIAEDTIAQHADFIIGMLAASIAIVEDTIVQCVEDMVGLDQSR